MRPKKTEGRGERETRSGLSVTCDLALIKLGAVKGDVAAAAAERVQAVGRQKAVQFPEKPVEVVLISVGAPARERGQAGPVRRRREGEPTGGLRGRRRRRGRLDGKRGVG